ncbi:MAG: HEAT repeat domain-containing protein [Desulfosarcinaceae bacterium]|nr:HEAT repeat domain-containing protein [Desulfosarcinaceae bacterium]
MPNSIRFAAPGRIVQALIGGLFIAQAIASIQVKLSNRLVLGRAEAMEAAGYLTIPNANIQSHLEAWGSAIAGGVFFTLSVGAGLTMVTLVLAQISLLLPDRRRGVQILGLILQGGALIRLNLDAIQAISTLYVLLVPWGVWGIFFYPRRRRQTALHGAHYLTPLLLPVVLLTLLWLPQHDKGMFIRIRDHILLSNPIGRVVNDYYYRHTLSPAAVFKPLSQRTLKGVSRSDLQQIPDTIRARLTATLTEWDYLPVDDGVAVDLRLHLREQQLVLSDGRGRSHPVTLEDLPQRLPEALRHFSRETDDKSFLRSLTFYGLLLGFPLCLYFSIYTTLALVTQPMAGPRGSLWTAGAGCLLLGAIAWWPVNAGRIASVEATEVGAALASDSLPRRLDALRLIHDQQLEITGFPQYRSLIGAGGIAERYWLARALGVSREQDTYADIIGLTKDDHPNVVCQAYYALGRRGNSSAIPVLIAQLRTSTHWYAQWYGYRSLKALGWRQTASR